MENLSPVFSLWVAYLTLWKTTSEDFAEYEAPIRQNSDSSKKKKNGDENAASIRESEYTSIWESYVAFNYLFYSSLVVHFLGFACRFLHDNVEALVRMLLKNQVLEKAAGIEVGPDSPLTIITPILDFISGGHHGGYEQGIGSGCHRRYTTTPVIHNYAITQTQREVIGQIEVKMKGLKSALDAKRRTTEEITLKIVEMERRHQEERDTFNAQMAQMHQFMSSFFQPSPGAPGYRFGSSDD